MLKPEAAQEELKKYKVTNWRRHCKEALDKLPGNLQELGLLLMEDDKYLKSAGFSLSSVSSPEEMDRREAKKRKKAMELDTLSKQDRLALFTALFPKLGHHVDRLWERGFSAPYQTGWVRKSFRAPLDPGVTFDNRWNTVQNLLRYLEGYEQDILWLAAWASHIDNYGFAIDLSLLLAAAIDAGGAEGEEVFQILVASAKGEHPIGSMSRHVPRALLSCSDPRGWEFIEKMLLAAQREEGLRQSIVETVDEAHPEAFKRMLRLILDNNLVRFSAIVRALDVWFGFAYDSQEAKPLNRVLEKVYQFLANPAARREAIKNENGEGVYLALWAEAFEDACAAVPKAAALLKDADVEKRFAAIALLCNLAITSAHSAGMEALEDEDLRVAAKAMELFQYTYGRAPDLPPESVIFGKLEKIFHRFPAKKKELPPIVWPWCKYAPDRNLVAALLIRNLGDVPINRILPYLPDMDANNRYMVAMQLEQQKKWDNQMRETLFTLVGDAGNTVREQAIRAVARMKVTENEARQLEGYLSRKASDLRRGIIQLLLNQPDKQALASADRLMDMSNVLHRTAGLEILRSLVEKDRVKDDCTARARSYKEKHEKLIAEEESSLDAILKLSGEEHPPEILTFDNALGLMNPEERSRPHIPVRKKLFNSMDAARECIASLEKLIDKHRETVVTITLMGQASEEPLGTVGWHFPWLAKREELDLPLRSLWETWWQDRPAKLRDKDGLELIRALALLYCQEFSFLREKVPAWLTDAKKAIYNTEKAINKKDIKYSLIVVRVLEWLVYFHPPQGAAEYALDAFETLLAHVPQEEVLAELKDKNYYHVSWYSRVNEINGYAAAATLLRENLPSHWTAAHTRRLWGLTRWMDEPCFEDTSLLKKLKNLVTKSQEPVRVRTGLRSSIGFTLAAYKSGAATEADLYDFLLGDRPNNRYGTSYGELKTLSRRKATKEFEEIPRLREILDRIRTRLLEIEVKRGDMPTISSSAALSLRYTGGLETVIPFLQALGKGNFTRGWTYDNMSRESLFSHVIRSSFPGEQDTPEAFREKVKASKITEKRLVEFGVYAPQWSKDVEYTLGWEGFSSAVFWIHAHTKDVGWTVDADIKEAWNAEVNEFTPLTGQDLIDGAVDVAWFNNVYRKLGHEKWKRIDDAAKFASTGAGHTRAQIFANAMLGKLNKEELITRIHDKRHQDSVRALGLLPVAEGNNRKADILERYKVFQEFRRSGKKFGSQKQESEKQAIRIGMGNLARTAGYPDPIRLEWAMEAEAVADLKDGSVTVEVDDVAVTLSIDALGHPDLQVMKKGKELKSIPANLKKNEQVAALKARVTDLRRQASRMKSSLEEAMIRGDLFSSDEVRDFMTHPLLKPLVSDLVFIADNEPEVIGYPAQDDAALRDYNGKERSIPTKAQLRIAHPTDLLATKAWSAWQGECFTSQRTQPFKQVFRELYILTETEKQDRNVSRRYAGHQLQPGKAVAVLGKRSWVNHPEEGSRRTFHDANLTASLTFLEGWFTPTEVEGVTMEGVVFSNRGEWKPLELETIPPRIFSEVMRDVDLVVSVAHRGGVDPEASASTVEMRASLLRETLSLLKISNVRIEGNRAFIDGFFTSYSLHLGSGVVHKMPGGQICIVPVHAQHRGRLFLPFADDDPRTAEVISKTLMLAKDKEIKDPTILEQVRA